MESPAAALPYKKLQCYNFLCIFTTYITLYYLMITIFIHGTEMIPLNWCLLFQYNNNPICHSNGGQGIAFKISRLKQLKRNHVTNVN